MIGVTYPNDPELTLGDVLAILISEQIRFDTLKQFTQSYQNPQYYNSEMLFRTLFKNFKQSVYNTWKENWVGGKKKSCID